MNKFWICVRGREAEKRPKTAEQMCRGHIQCGGMAGIGSAHTL